jgi:hypothetical protein
MKKARADSGSSSFGSGNIRKDLTKSQRAGIGEVAIAFNEAEAVLDLLLVFVLGLHQPLGAEVTSRINGLEGKVEIAKAGMQNLMTAVPNRGDKDIKILLSETLGNEGFLSLKRYRDAVIHAYRLDVPTGTARTSTKRGKSYEVLMTEKALKSLYDRLLLVRNELWEACTIAATLSRLRLSTWLIHNAAAIHPPAFANWRPTIKRSERDTRVALSRYRRHQTRRLSLPPLPEFPAESELWQARRQWLKDHQDSKESSLEHQVSVRRLHPAEIGMTLLPRRKKRKK